MKESEQLGVDVKDPWSVRNQATQQEVIAG